MSVTPTGPAQFGIIQAMAPSLRVEVGPINVRDAAEIEQGINAFARSSNDGLIVTAGGPAAHHRDLIVALAARHNLPAVYFERSFVDVGGLVSYGADYLDQFRCTAGYVVATIFVNENLFSTGRTLTFQLSQSKLIGENRGCGTRRRKSYASTQLTWLVGGGVPIYPEPLVIIEEKNRGRFPACRSEASAVSTGAKYPSQRQPHCWRDLRCRPSS